MTDRLQDLIALRDKTNASISRYQRLRRYNRDCPPPAEFSGFIEASCALDNLEADLRKAQAEAEAEAIRRNQAEFDV